MKKFVMFLLVFTFWSCKEEILLPEVRDGESTFVTLKDVLPNDQYPAGGVEIIVWKDNNTAGIIGELDENDEIISSMIVQNGSSGSGDGTVSNFSVTSASSDDCPNGGVNVSFTLTTDGESTEESFTVCNGENGKDGKDGKDGKTCFQTRFTELFDNNTESADAGGWTYSNFYGGTTNLISGNDAKFENTWLQTPKLDFDEINEIVIVVFMDEFKYRPVIVYSDGTEEALDVLIAKWGTYRWEGSWSNVDYIRFEVENITPHTVAGISDVHVLGFKCK